ncbi:MAG TPA: FkbM family methyltransferase [Beijerinckiaceae bacterium]|nr:FkbM family methyltransferase [Beijerinckiaceae bacterium]
MPDLDRSFGSFAPTGFMARLLETTRALPTHGLGKTLGFALRRLASMMLHGKPLDVEAYGAKFRLYPYNNVCESRILFFPRQFDEEERRLLAERMKPGFHFVDIGANIGGYALAVAALAGPAARILAVEPLPEIFSRLAFNVRQNPFGTVKALELAVADKDGDMTLFIDPYNQGESSLKIITTAEGTAVRVPARKLTTILREERFERIDALKLDTEGAEDLILECFFGEADERLFPRLIILQSTPERWNINLFALIEQHGYRIIAETRNNVVYERG